MSSSLSIHMCHKRNPSARGRPLLNMPVCKWTPKLPHCSGHWHKKDTEVEVTGLAQVVIRVVVCVCMLWWPLTQDKWRGGFPEIIHYWHTVCTRNCQNTWKEEPTCKQLQEKWSWSRVISTISTISKLANWVTKAVRSTSPTYSRRAMQVWVAGYRRESRWTERLQTLTEGPCLAASL